MQTQSRKPFLPPERGHLRLDVANEESVDFDAPCALHQFVDLQTDVITGRVGEEREGGGSVRLFQKVAVCASKWLDCQHSRHTVCCNSVSEGKKRGGERTLVYLAHGGVSWELTKFFEKILSLFLKQICILLVLHATDAAQRHMQRGGWGEYP